MSNESREHEPRSTTNSLISIAQEPQLPRIDFAEPRVPVYTAEIIPFPRDPRERPSEPRDYNWLERGFQLGRAFVLGAIFVVAVIAMSAFGRGEKTEEHNPYD